VTRLSRLPSKSPANFLAASERDLPRLPSRHSRGLQANSFATSGDLFAASHS
jgi:hypothetical protein